MRQAAIHHRLTPQQFAEAVTRINQLPGLPLLLDRRPLPCNFGEPAWVRHQCGQRGSYATVEDEE